MSIDDLLIIFNKYGSNGLALSVGLLIAFKLFKPVLDNWMAERAVFIAELKESRAAATLIASNHIVHLQASIDESSRSFQNSQLVIVNILKEVVAKQTETTLIMNNLHDNMNTSFTNLQNVFRDTTRPK